MNNNNDVKITSKEHDNTDEKEVNESILMLGDRLVDTNYNLIPETCSLFTNSDQESTSGDEDVLGEFVSRFDQTLKLQLKKSYRRRRNRQTEPQLRALQGYNSSQSSSDVSGD